MSPEEFRRLGHELIDRIADYRAGVGELPVMAQVEPGAIRAALPKAAPEAAEPFEAIFADLDALILPGLSHFNHPGFFGYFPSNGELSSVLGDYLSTGLGALGLSWQSAPALTELEEVVADWMRQLLGLPESFKGVIQDTASTSTLVALISAREKLSDFSLARGGLAGLDAPLVVYGSAHAQQFRRQGGAAGRLRPRQPSSCRDRRRLRDPSRRAGGGDPRRSRSRPQARRRRRHRRHDRRDRFRPDRRDRRNRQGARAVAACRRGDGGLGDDPAGNAQALDGNRGRRIRWCSIRTNGWARPSTARSITCAIPST